MKSFNNNEMDFQEKLQKDTEIPVIVHERINQAYRMIENDTAMQKKTPKDPYHWMKIGSSISIFFCLSSINRFQCRCMVCKISKEAYVVL